MVKSYIGECLISHFLFTAWHGCQKDSKIFTPMSV